MQVLISTPCARFNHHGNQKVMRWPGVVTKIRCTTLKPVNPVAHRYGAHVAANLLHSCSEGTGKKC